ncbi:MAG: hypothetical protein HZB16_13605 [Armatimonadetes bacterium]|nr:hypothetical protein [Armatimonadota bacterium]
MSRAKLLVNLPPGFHSVPQLQPVFERLADRFELRRTSHNAPDEIAADLAWADAVLMWSWPALDDDLLDRAPNLRMSAQLDVGGAAARVALRRGFPLSVARGGFSPAVAEFALGLILNGLRRISDFHAEMRLGTEPWVRSYPDDIDPRERELTGASVGLVGFGGVGRRLAELLGPFHCDLRVYDPFVADEPVATAGGRRVELADLISQSDVVVLCAANNAGTKHLLDEAAVSRLREGALLVNVARSALVDGAALARRVAAGEVTAMLDVFDTEPLPADSPWRGLAGAYLTPHRAGGLLSSTRRILEALADDLEACFDGRPRRWALTEAMLPGLDG